MGKNIEEQRRWEAKMERKNDEQLEKERMADEVKSAAKQEEIDKRLAGMAKKRQSAVNARDAFRVKEDTEKKTIQDKHDSMMKTLRRQEVSVKATTKSKERHDKTAAAEKEQAIKAAIA